MNRIFKKARSLCAVLLSAALVFSGAVRVRAEEETTAPAVQPLAEGESYVYNVTVTFGSFDFYYDYGTWDSQNLKYAANQSSSYPAAGTVNTFPGWYGFDGTANKITVENSSTEGEVQVTVQYTDTPLEGDTTDDTEFPLRPGSVTMSCYDDAELTLTAAGAIPNGCSFSMSGVDADLQPTQKDIYVSFSGVPLNTDSTNFKSEQTKRIGYITMTVSLQG